MEDKPKRKRSEHEEKPCAVCGGTEFVWGLLMNGIRFLPDEKINWFNRPLIASRYRVRARVCANCRNMQLFVGE
jgi:hypothetical protein